MGLECLAFSKEQARGSENIRRGFAWPFQKGENVEHSLLEGVLNSEPSLA